MDKADAVIIGVDMEREERLIRMEELLDKEDFNEVDYNELKKLINDMENERRILLKKYTQNLQNIK